MSSSIAAQYDGFLIDLDGVVLVDGEPVSGAVTALERLRDEGKAIWFVTNNSRATRDEIEHQLNQVDIQATVDEIVTAASATVQYLLDNDIKSVYPVAAPGFMDELRGAGIRLRRRHVDGVVVGLDSTVTYSEIRTAARRIYHDEAVFIAANVDMILPTREGIAPGTGAIVAAIEAIVDESPTVVGKPNSRMFEIALTGLEKDHAVMIGDNPRSDIEGANRAGIDSVLVTDSSGEESAASSSDADPVAVISGLGDLYESQ